MSSYSGRLSLHSLPKANSSSTRGRMDPAGFEPVSATWTECYVPITPRALAEFPQPRRRWQGLGSQLRQACAKLGPAGVPAFCVLGSLDFARDFGRTGQALVSPKTGETGGHPRTFWLVGKWSTFSSSTSANIKGPAFNVADSAIVVGAGLLVIEILFTKAPATEKSA